MPRPLDDEVAAVLRELPAYRLVVFTSANAVRVFVGYLARGRRAGGMPAGPVVAAIGPATASALEKRGVACHVVPDESVAEGLARGAGGRRRPRRPARACSSRRAREARDVLPDTLRARGAVVDVLPVYDTVTAGELAVPAERVEAADFITFTSSSTASAVRGADGGGGRRARQARPAARPSGSPAPRLCSIGPVTSDMLASWGCRWP